MPTYPTLPQERETKVQLLPSVTLVTAGNGLVRGFATQSTPHYSISPVHDWLSLAEWNQLLSFYVANRLEPFDFTDQATSVTYTGCLFVRDNALAWEARPGGRFRVSTKFQN